MQYSRPGIAGLRPTEVLDFTRVKHQQEPLVNTDPLVEHKIIAEKVAREKANGTRVSATTNFQNVLTAEEQEAFDRMSAAAVSSPLVDIGGTKV